MVEILKQGQYAPVPVERQVLIIYAGNEAFLDDLPLEQIRAFEEGLYRFVENAHPGLLTSIREKKNLDDALKAQMTAALKEYKARFVQEHSQK
jgi:F-type H+-transporting ATPase subunit alpha